MARISCSEFLEQFVFPLVAGGNVRVGAPLSEQDLERFCNELPHASVPLVAIDEARRKALATLVVRVPAFVLDADELYLAAAVHNLLFLVHPRRYRWMVTEAFVERVLAVSMVFAAQPFKRDRTRVLARHALFHGLLRLRREDTTLTWWSGRADFHGQKPPKRLLTWSRLRRLRRKTQVIGFRELLGKSELLPTLATLLHRSPLTLLLADQQDALPFRWEDAAFVLQDAELTRAISYRAVEHSDVKTCLTVCARYGLAFEHMLARDPTPGQIQLVAAFLVHLNALVMMTFPAEEVRDVYDRFASTVVGEDTGIRGLFEFLALPEVLRSMDVCFAEPPDLQADARLASRWQQHQKMLVPSLAQQLPDWRNRIAEYWGGCD